MTHVLEPPCGVNNETEDKETGALPSRFPGNRGRPLNVFLDSPELAMLSCELPFLRVNDALKLLDLAGFFGSDGKCKEQ